MTERRHTRLVAPIGVILTVGGEAQACQTRNISRGGLFAPTRLRASEGTEVSLELVHSGRRLVAKARVATVTDHGLGLEFVEVDHEFREAVGQLMEDVVRTQSSEQPSLSESQVFEVFWSHLPDGRWWRAWGKGRRKVEILDVTFDGAFVVSKKPPPVGDTILFTLSAPWIEDKGEVTCRAEVIRQTDNGFAVRFEAAKLPFRRVISRIRKNKFGSH